MNPHYFNESPSFSNFSFVSDNNQQSNNKINNNLSSRYHILSYKLNTIYKKTILKAFFIIKLKPAHIYESKTRLIKVFLTKFKQNQGKLKFFAFQVLKRNVFHLKNKQIKQLTINYKINQASALKLLVFFLNNKQKILKKLGFQKILSISQQQLLKRNIKYRKAFRIIIKLKNKKLHKYLNLLKNTYYLLSKQLKSNHLLKILNQTFLSHVKYQFQKLKQSTYKQKTQQITQKITQNHNKIQHNQDYQIQNLIKKQSQLKNHIQLEMKDKMEIQQMFRSELFGVNTKSLGIKHLIEQKKLVKQSLIDQIVICQANLNQQYSLNQIFHMCYLNLLFYILNNKNKPLIKSAMLKRLSYPLLPINLPLQKLKQQNQTMKSLISEYILMFGVKQQNNKKISLNYEDLINENQNYNKILLSLLTRIQFNKKQIKDLKVTILNIQQEYLSLTK